MAFLDRSKFPGLVVTVYLTAVALCLHGALTTWHHFSGYELALVLLTAPLFPLLMSVFDFEGPVAASVLAVLCALANAWVIHRVFKSIFRPD